MKRAVLFLLFISSGFVLTAPGSAAAATITHSVSASMTGYVPVDPHEFVSIVDPQVAHLFDVTFDNTGTSYDVYDTSNDIMRTETLDSFKESWPDTVFLSNASFEFSAEFLTVFSLLGISGPEEGVFCQGFVAGMYNDDYPDDPMSYWYVFSFYHSETDVTAINFRTSYWQMFGVVYDHFSYDPANGFDWGNNAGYNQIQYEDITRRSVPTGAILELLIDSQ